MGHLILGRRQGERVLIGNDIVMEVIWIGREAVRLGFKAPRSISIVRDELTIETDLEIPICQCCKSQEEKLIELGKFSHICQHCLVEAVDRFENQT